MANRYIKILRENDISVKGGTKLGPSQVKFYQADTDNFTYSIDYTRWLDGSTISGTPTTTASACTATASNSTTVITLTVTAVSGTAEVEIQTTAADGRVHTLFMQVMERFASPYAPSIFGGGSSPSNPTLPNPSTALSMLRVNTAGNAYELRTPSQVAEDIGAEVWESVRSVKESDFGAVGDGSTDDTEAIQAAIDWAGLGAGRAIFFPDGEYLVSDTLVSAPSGTTSSITMFAYNPEKVTIKRTFLTGHTLVIGDASGPSSGAPRIQGIGFQHGTAFQDGDTSIDYEIADSTEYAHVVLYGGQEPHINDCHFNRMPIGVKLVGVTIAHVEHCRFGQVWDYTDSDMQEGVAAIKFEKSATHGSCKDAYISHNFFAGANSEERDVTYGATTLTAADDDFTENIGGQYAILIEDLETATIHGNYFGGLGKNAIKFDIQASQSALNLSISGNFFDAARLYAIDVEAANGTYFFNSTISGNSFNCQRNGEGAIKITDNGSGTESASCIVISDNSIANGVKTPVHINGAVNVNFSGNILTGYNYHNGGSTTDWAVGAYFGSACSLINCTGNAYGGGGNLADASSPPNYTKWGVYFAAATVGNAFGERSLGFGLGGGGLITGINPEIEHSLTVTGTIPGFGTNGNQFFADVSGSVARYGSAAGGGSAMTGNEECVSGTVVRKISSSGTEYLKEASAAAADSAGWGQWWVKDDTPNTPMFTDDAGNDREIVRVSTAATANGCELIETQSVSGASEIVIDDMSSEYRMYEIVITDLTVATDGTNLRLRTSTDNGSSFDSGGSDYTTKLRYSWGSSAYTQFYSTDGLPALALGLGNDTNENSTLVLKVFNPSNASFTRIETTLYGRDGSGTFGEFVGCVTRLSAADVDAIRVFADAGNISGDVAVYGYRAA